MVNPAQIRLDIQNEKMYWLDWITGKVSRANLDGTNNEVLFEQADIQPSHIDFDWDNQEMYWTDSKALTIEKIKFDTFNYFT